MRSPQGFTFFIDKLDTFQGQQMWALHRVCEMCSPPREECGRAGSHSGECKHCFPLLWPGHVGLGGLMAPGLCWSQCLRNLWPWVAKSAYYFMWEHSVWRHLQCHFGLSKPAMLAGKRLPPPDQRDKAAPVLWLLAPSRSFRYISGAPFPVVFQAPQHHRLS